MYKVVHHKDDVETVYLISADCQSAAKARVLDVIYERSDPFYGELSNNGIAHKNGCSIAATPWEPDEPYRLYSLNTATGAMS